MRHAPQPRGLPSPAHRQPHRIPHPLIRQTAITAIHDGTERITKAALDAVQLDHLAETHHRPRQGR